ncbi:DHH family phosphoesterase [Tindallia californiensis]|uniref:Phosphoesterase RecJ domain-containing protein n=1 Tax=Tindallia californiensis TaxID=159292 RepID=A0A1H3NP38_9FIRM|nr:bifunctional oligoribonuclease/PAP phosphatase NrnA [Tindallia californiensis]SDY90558.1 phosphoesterase RecJ domain-containing protein [Tindallia californiensis]
MNSKWVQTFGNLLKCSQVALVTHVFPDGDAYGSLLGLKNILEQHGVEVFAYVEDKNSNGKFSFLPGYETLITFDSNTDRQFPMAVVLDCGEKKRVAGGNWIFEHATKIINIDHHISNSFFGHDNIVSEKFSSTCELIWYLAKRFTELITNESATCLITGIMTDTGNFLYDNTSAQTFRASADLIDKNADIKTVKFNLFHSKSLSNIRLLGYAIQNLQIILGGKVAFLNLDKYTMDQFNVSYEDLDDFVAFIRDIEGVEVAILLKETKNKQIKISLRSKSYFDVNKFAQEFNGGGHKKAAGALSNENMESTEKLVIDLLKNYF